MPHYLRKVRKAKWLTENYRWLSEGDIQADALYDLRTIGNELSVYLLNEKDELDQIIAALALTCNVISNIDYALIIKEDLENLEIKIVKSHGDTPDDTVNSKHYDLCELSAIKVMNLAQLISHSEIRRFTEPEVKQRAAQALFENRIDQTKIRLDQESHHNLEEFVERLHRSNF